MLNVIRAIKSERLKHIDYSLHARKARDTYRILIATAREAIREADGKVKLKWFVGRLVVM
jgi:hypothetical protein